MSSRAERQVALLAEQIAFQHQVRAIEAVHGALNEEMLNWGRWGQERFPGCPPQYAALRHLNPIGDDERDLDPNSIVEPKEDPIDEKRAEELDCLIHQAEFVALWRKILRINYVWRPTEWERPVIIRVGERTYLEQLHLALLELAR